jgi:membrane protease subunit HflK
MALNDPQWGRRGGGGDGPPDLDELWNRLRQRVSGLFGGRGGPRDGGGAGGGFAGGAWIIVALVLVVWLGSGLYIVDASQRGVVLRFGKPDRNANGTVLTTMPGPRWHLPWPIESVEIVNVGQVRTIEIGYRNNVRMKVPKESLMLTQDENIIDLQFAVQYLLKDPGEYLFNNRAPDDAVMQAAESAMREVVGKSTMEDVLYKGREDVRSAAQARMQKILDEYQTGISVSQLTLQQAQPPEQVQAAFDDAVKANQDRERQINEGEAYRNDVVPKASGTASRLVQEAEGYRQRVVANAEGEASRFKSILAEYSRAPAVTRERLYLEAMQQVYSSTSKVMVDQKAGGSLLLLPLEKILQMSAAGAAPTDGNDKPAATDVSPAAPPAGDTRARDNFRSREREARP